MPSISGRSRSTHCESLDHIIFVYRLTISKRPQTIRKQCNTYDIICSPAPASATPVPLCRHHPPSPRDPKAILAVDEHARLCHGGGARLVQHTHRALLRRHSTLLFQYIRVPGWGEGQVGRAWVGWGVGRGSTVGNVGAPLPPPPAPPKAPRPRSPVLGLAYLAVISVLLKPGCL